MKRYVTDTQCLLWHMGQDRHLPKAMKSIFDASEDGRIAATARALGLPLLTVDPAIVESGLVEVVR